jgi:hypothetical protein
MSDNNTTTTIPRAVLVWIPTPAPGPFLPGFIMPRERIPEIKLNDGDELVLVPQIGGSNTEDMSWIPGIVPAKSLRQWSTESDITSGLISCGVHAGKKCSIQDAVKVKKALGMVKEIVSANNKLWTALDSNNKSYSNEFSTTPTPPPPPPSSQPQQPTITNNNNQQPMEIEINNQLLLPPPPPPPMDEATMLEVSRLKKELNSLRRRLARTVTKAKDDEKEWNATVARFEVPSGLQQQQPTSLSNTIDSSSLLSTTTTPTQQPTTTTTTTTTTNTKFIPAPHITTRALHTWHFIVQYQSNLGLHLPISLDSFMACLGSPDPIHTPMYATIAGALVTHLFAATPPPTYTATTTTTSSSNSSSSSSPIISTTINTPERNKWAFVNEQILPVPPFVFSNLTWEVGLKRLVDLNIIPLQAAKIVLSPNSSGNNNEQPNNNDNNDTTNNNSSSPLTILESLCDAITNLPSTRIALTSKRLHALATSNNNNNNSSSSNHTYNNNNKSGISTLSDTLLEVQAMMMGGGQSQLLLQGPSLREWTQQERDNDRIKISSFRLSQACKSEVITQNIEQLEVEIELARDVGHEILDPLTGIVISRSPEVAAALKVEEAVTSKEHLHYESLISEHNVRTVPLGYDGNNRLLFLFPGDDCLPHVRIWAFNEQTQEWGYYLGCEDILALAEECQGNNPLFDTCSTLKSIVKCATRALRPNTGLSLRLARNSGWRFHGDPLLLRPLRLCNELFGVRDGLAVAWKFKEGPNRVYKIILYGQTWETSSLEIIGDVLVGLIDAYQNLAGGFVSSSALSNDVPITILPPNEQYLVVVRTPSNLIALGVVVGTTSSSEQQQQLQHLVLADGGEFLLLKDDEALKEAILSCQRPDCPLRFRPHTYLLNDVSASDRLGEVLLPNMKHPKPTFEELKNALISLEESENEKKSLWPGEMERKSWINSAKKAETVSELVLVLECLYDWAVLNQHQQQQQQQMQQQFQHQQQQQQQIINYPMMMMMAAMQQHHQQHQPNMIINNQAVVPTNNKMDEE